MNIEFEYSIIQNSKEIGKNYILIQHNDNIVIKTRTESEYRNECSKIFCYASSFIPWYSEHSIISTNQHVCYKVKYQQEKEMKIFDSKDNTLIKHIFFNGKIYDYIQAFYFLPKIIQANTKANKKHLFIISAPFVPDIIPAWFLEEEVNMKYEVVAPLDGKFIYKDNEYLQHYQSFTQGLKFELINRYVHHSPTGINFTKFE